jgi:transcriptional regulator with GAF, ATPase, and Fis domain
MMQRFRAVLLDVWREACRHIDIQESTLLILQRIAQHLPVRQLIIRQLDLDQSCIVTIAAARSVADETMASHRRQLSDTERRQVNRWCQRGKLLRRGKRMAGILSLIVAPSEQQEHLVAVPLFTEDGPEGAALLVAKSGMEFEDEALRLFEDLREPLSVALQNDRRMRELAKLRETAEAERGALLRRLGRTDLGETIVGEQRGLSEVMKRVMLVVHSDVPVLILGETGTGKEVIARALHTRSARHEGPFIRVNCGAIPAELIDSQLFGHEKGSFTGAAESREGWFERADGGTLFLDEIGELPLEAQVRFLRVLQDGFVERVGGNKPVHVDVRVVAATHRDLATMVRERTFREDLWYRLAVFPILLPPLRQRRDDIPEMAVHFAERAAMRFGLAAVSPTVDDVQLLQAYDWPGNIRELGAVIDRAVILGEGRRLEIAKALGWNAGNPVERIGPAFTDAPINEAGGLSDVLSLDEAVRQHICAVLRRTRGRIEGPNGAAAMLEINPHTLRARMRKLNVNWSAYRTEAHG